MKEQKVEQKVMLRFYLDGKVMVTASKLDVKGTRVTLENGMKESLYAIDVYADGLYAESICGNKIKIIDDRDYSKPGRLSCIMPVLDKKTGEKTYNGGLPQSVKLSDIIDAGDIVHCFLTHLDKKPKSDNITNHCNDKEKGKSKWFGFGGKTRDKQ